MRGGVFAVIAILAVFSLVVQPGWAVTCGQVDSALAPCIGYLIGTVGSPSQPCCAGVRAVKAMAKTTADKRTSCNCVKAAASRYTNLKDSAAQTLPTKCGVQLDIVVSRTDQMRRGIGTKKQKEQQ
ncbi:non-specific lipid-transfer protein [Striga asiatica]|uniref:Non-specific lipid-transfer protein n=1 Tax=Striga asiatica TaxID=4170 RepID=A0A5A7QVJ8_STRAF|nr:non-specific lipid-transfer protein [Striga asiatica]